MDGIQLEEHIGHYLKSPVRKATGLPELSHPTVQHIPSRPFDRRWDPNNTVHECTPYGKLEITWHSWQWGPSSSCCFRLLSCTLNRDLSTVLRFGDSMITSLSSVAATWACKELDVAFMSQFMFVFISPTAVRAMAVATLPSVLRLTVTHNTIAKGDRACFALHTLKLLTTL